MPSVELPTTAALDCFPCGLVITNRECRSIVKANHYFYELCGLSANSAALIGSVFTQASRIMLESYVVPLLLNQRRCDEIQLSLSQPNGSSLPVLVNARITAEQPELIHWVITAAQQRDELYQELVNLRNHLEQKAEALSTLAKTDELTGLLNRRAFIENANHLIAKKQDKGVFHAFFMIDIDNFKAINDEYGHSVGDKVLRDIAKIFQRNSREGDTLARVGGEEFALFSVVKSSRQAYDYAERLRSAVCERPIAGISITVSIGLATSSTQNLSALFKQADKLLYEVKTSGKNQVMLATMG